MKQITKQLIEMKIEELKLEIQHKYWTLEDSNFIEFHEFHNLEIEMMKNQIDFLMK